MLACASFLQAEPFVTVDYMKIDNRMKQHSASMAETAGGHSGYKTGGLNYRKDFIAGAQRASRKRGGFGRIDQREHTPNSLLSAVLRVYIEAYL